MTLKDIAQEAGVSIMTVSNVINGKHARVSQKTIEKVNQIVKKYNYVPNLTARSLTVRSSKIIAIIVPLRGTESHDEDNLFDDPYICNMLGVIEQQIRKNGYYPMIRSASEIADINKMLRTWNIDGALFLLPELDTIDDIIKANQQPMVFLDSRYHTPDILSVNCNDHKGLYMSTQYLISRGHTKIAFVAGYAGNPLLEARFGGYQAALADSGIALNPDYLIDEAVTYDGGILAGKRLAKMRSEVTAAVTTADICALGIMEGARQEGVRIPVDLSIVGFDNLAICNYTTPKLTTVSQNIPLKAYNAVKLLLEKIDTGKVENNSLIIDVEMIERQSVVSII